LQREIVRLRHGREAGDSPALATAIRRLVAIGLKAKAK
jgi:hypothetical protein